MYSYCVCCCVAEGRQSCLTCFAMELEFIVDQTQGLLQSFFPPEEARKAVDEVIFVIIPSNWGPGGPPSILRVTISPRN